MWKQFVLIGFILILFVTSTGCGNNNNQQKMKSFDKDGYLGITNTNPNLPTSPNFHTYSTDVTMIKRALKKVKEIQRQTIMINGANIFISILLPRQLSAHEKEVIRKKAVREVTYMMPRYHVNVSLLK